MCTFNLPEQNKYTNMIHRLCGTYPGINICWYHKNKVLETHGNGGMRIQHCGYWYRHDDVIKWKHFPRYWPFVGNSPVPGEFPAQRPVTRSFDVFFDLNKRLSKQSWGWWFETLSYPLWRHRNVVLKHQVMSTHSADWIFTELDYIHEEMLQLLWITLKNK